MEIINNFHCVPKFISPMVLLFLANSIGRLYNEIVIITKNDYSNFNIIKISGGQRTGMRQIYDFAANELKRQNIRLSYRRRKVLEYLCQNQNHPTVDQIYVNLQKKVPNLSKTTIYNTLNTLAEAGLVITVEDNETRYDIKTKKHGHFRCEECGAIFDFNMDFDLLAAEELIGFKIVDKNVYFKGVCPECLLNINNND